MELRRTVGIGFAVLLALIVGYPCFRLKIVGHYFALVTLALSQVVMLSIVAARDVTGGSLGFTPKAVGHSWYALQFPEKVYFYAISLALWFGGLAVRCWIDCGTGREALDAISEDEEAAGSVGINVIRERLRVTLISAALGGAIYGQYMMYLNPETVSSIAVSLQIVFAAIVGGTYAAVGPTVGSTDHFLERGLAGRVRDKLHRGSQHNLWNPSRSLHHFHAARDRRHDSRHDERAPTRQGCVL